jgi:hypothetical protein
MAAILIRLTKRPDRAVDQALSLLSLFTAMDNPLARGVVSQLWGSPCRGVFCTLYVRSMVLLPD